MQDRGMQLGAKHHSLWSSLYPARHVPQQPVRACCAYLWRICRQGAQWHTPRATGHASKRSCSTRPAEQSHEAQRHAGPPEPLPEGPVPIAAPSASHTTVTSTLQATQTMHQLNCVVHAHAELLDTTHILVAIKRALWLHISDMRVEGHRTGSQTKAQFKAQEAEALANLVGLIVGLLTKAQPCQQQASAGGRKQGNSKAGCLLHAYDMHGLAQLAWALVKLNAAPSLAPHVATCIVRATHTAAPLPQQKQQQAGKATAADKQRRNGPRQGVARVYMSALDACPPRTLVTLLWCFGSWGWCSPQAVDALSAALLPALGRASPWEVAMAAWALGRLRYRPPHCGLVAALASPGGGRVQAQGVVGLLNLVWGLSYLLQTREAGRELMAAVSVRVVALAPQLAALPREGAALMASLGRLGHSDPSVWRTVQAQVGQAGLIRWDSTSVACLVCAYARHGRPCPDVLAALEQQLLAGGNNLTSQADGPSPGPISDPVPPSDGHVCVEDAGRPQVAAGAVISEGLVGRPQDAAMLVWAVASLYKASQRALAAATAAAAAAQSQRGDAHGTQLGAGRSRLQGGNAAAELTIKRCSHIAALLVPTVAAHIVGGRVTHQQAAMMLWACTVTGVAKPQVLQATTTLLAPQLHLLPPRVVAMVCSALGTLPRAASDARRRGGLEDGGQQEDNSSSSTPSFGSDGVGCGPANWWWSLCSHAPQLLPRLHPTELAAVTVAAARAGVTDRRIYGVAAQAAVAAASADAAIRLERLQASPNCPAIDPALKAVAALAPRVPLAPTAAGTVGGEQPPPCPPSPPVLVQLMWALAQVGLSSKALTALTVLVCTAPDSASRLSPALVVQLLTACSTAGVYNSVLWGTLTTRILGHAGTMLPTDLVAVMAVMARVGYYDQALTERVCAVLSTPRALAALSPHHLVELAWVVALLGAGVFMEWRFPMAQLAAGVDSMAVSDCAVLLWSMAAQQHVLFDSGSASDRGGVRHQRHKGTLAAVHQPPPSQRLRSSHTGSPSPPSPPSPPPPWGPTPCVDPGLPPGSHPGTQPDQGGALRLLQALLAKVCRADPHEVAQHPRTAFAIAQALSWLLRCRITSVVDVAARAVVGDMPHGMVGVLQAAWQPIHAPSQPPMRPAGEQGARQFGAPAGSAVHSLPGQVPGGSGWGHGSGRRALGHDGPQLTGDQQAWADAGAPSTLRHVRSEVACVLRELGLAPVDEADTWRQLMLQQQPGASEGNGGSYSAHAAHVVSLFPAAGHNLVLLPQAKPRPVALVLAARQAMARNDPTEPLGPLFTDLQLLSDGGWYAQMVVVETWCLIRGGNEKIEFMQQLLLSCGIET